MIERHFLDVFFYDAPGGRPKAQEARILSIPSRSSLVRGSPDPYAVMGITPKRASFLEENQMGMGQNPGT